MHSSNSFFCLRKARPIALCPDNVLNGLVGILESGDETIFGDLVGRAFDHHHFLLATNVDQVEGGIVHLLVGRVDHEFTVDLTQAYAPDRAVPWNVGDHQGGRSAVDHQDAGFVNLIG